MVHYSKVFTGVEKYIRNDILAQLNGSPSKWLCGTIVALAMLEMDRVYRWCVDKLPIAQAVGVIDGENINVDKIYPLLLNEARQGSATLVLKVIPPLTLTEKDVESLYRYIKGA